MKVPGVTVPSVPRPGLGPVQPMVVPVALKVKLVARLVVAGKLLPHLPYLPDVGVLEPLGVPHLLQTEIFLHQCSGLLKTAEDPGQVGP